jgi:hypothetical protein
MSRELRGAYLKVNDPLAQEPTATQCRLVDRWAKTIFEVWSPHRNPADGGVVIVHRTSSTHARIAWMSYALYRERSREGSQPPTNLPAHERVGVADRMTPNVPDGDVAWVVFISHNRKVEYLASLQWPISIEGDS